MDLEPKSNPVIYTMDLDNMTLMLKTLLSSLGPKVTSSQHFESFANFVQQYFLSLERKLKTEQETRETQVAELKELIKQQNQVIANLLNVMGVVGLDEANFMIEDANLEVTHPDGTLPVTFGVDDETGKLTMRCDIVDPQVELNDDDGHVYLTYDENDPTTTG